jgi:hypothetical protein
MSPDWALALTRYVLAHDGHARYFIGSIAPAKVAPLLEVDPKPVLMLTSYRSRPLISVPALRAKVQAGEVRFFLLGHRCSGADIARTAACPPTARWVIAHGTDVTGAAGVPHGGLLYRIQFPLRNGR